MAWMRVDIVKIWFDGSVGVHQVAEHQRVGRAGLYAGRIIVAPGDGFVVQAVAVPSLHLQFAAPDALDAEGALFGDTARAHRNVGVQLVLHARRPVGMPEVEHPDLVGAVVDAVPGAHAAVVHLDVEPFLVVVGGVHRAHRLAGGVFAVLAQHRHEPRLDVGVLTLPVAFNADPFVGPPLEEVILGVDGDVVLGLAGNHAGLTARALVQVNDHPPLVFMLGVGHIPFISPVQPVKYPAWVSDLPPLH